MLRRLIARRIAARERQLGVPLDYVRFVLGASLPAFLKYVMFQPLGQHSDGVPAAELFVARAVATRHEDCGSCVQIVVNLARQSGVPREILEAVVAGTPERLSPQLRDIYSFSDAVVRGEDPAALRETLRGRYGDEGLATLAFAIASARVFPTTKRALGYAVSCERTTIRI